LEHYFIAFLDWFGMPSVGLPAVFLVALISATLLPMGSEPVLFAYVSVNPNMLWPAIVVATVGNTIGGMVNWFLGLGARNAFEAYKGPTAGRMQRWLVSLGPKMLLLSWLPGIGDPLCALAGWLRMPWKACLIYMAIGKFLRYVTFTLVLVSIPSEFWHAIGRFIGIGT
jgi:membrane protein YqaA with SNARE-associated domain